MHCGGLPPLERLARIASAQRGEVVGGCGRELTLEADREDRLTWDVRTETTNGTEFVVERSHVVRCPYCGYEGDENKLVEQPDKPIPFELHEPAMNWARAARLEGLS
jgi:hypothetical protein